MNDKNYLNRVRVGALAVSVAVTMAAAIALTTASEYHAPRADAQTQRGAMAADGGSVSLLPNAPNDDPELMRVDRANEHHG